MDTPKTQRTASKGLEKAAIGVVYVFLASLAASFLLGVYSLASLVF